MDMYSITSPTVQFWCKWVAQIANPRCELAPPFTDRPFAVLCMTPRSGSTYLGSLMRENGLGNGTEHFRVSGGAMERFCKDRKITTYDDYIRKIIELRTKDGIFTAKVDWLQYIPIYYFGMHDHYFKSAQFIFLTRSDILMQAISRYIATETGYSHSINVEKAHTAGSDISFDFAKITQHIEHLIYMQSA